MYCCNQTHWFVVEIVVLFTVLLFIYNSYLSIAYFRVFIFSTLHPWKNTKKTANSTHKASRFVIVCEYSLANSIKEHSEKRSPARPADYHNYHNKRAPLFLSAALTLYFQFHTQGHVFIM